MIRVASPRDTQDLLLFRITSITTDFKPTPLKALVATTGLVSIENADPAFITLCLIRMAALYRQIHLRRTIWLQLGSVDLISANYRPTSTKTRYI